MDKPYLKLVLCKYDGHKTSIPAHYHRLYLCVDEREYELDMGRDYKLNMSLNEVTTISADFVVHDFDIQKLDGDGKYITAEAKIGIK